MKASNRRMAGIGAIGWALLLSGCGQEGATPPSSPVGAAPVEAVAGAGTVSSPPAMVPRGEEVRAVETAGLLPPGARIVPAERVAGAIAFAFQAAEAPAAVARWYRAARGFRLQSELDEGGEHVLSGATTRPAGDFSVRLAARPGGGTTAMVLVTPR